MFLSEAKQVAKQLCEEYKEDHVILYCHAPSAYNSIHESESYEVYGRSEYLADKLWDIQGDGRWFADWENWVYFNGISVPC